MTRRFPHLAWVISLMVLITTLCGCTPAPTPPLRLGTNVWPGYELFYLARDLKYVDDKNIRLVEHSSATQVIRSYRNGTLDAAALTLDEALLLAEDGHDIKVIAILDYSQGADCIMGKPHVKTLSQVKGQRVGVEDTALGGYMLDLALREANMDESQIKIAPMPVDEHESAYRQGRVDAVVTFEPVCTTLHNIGANRLFDSAQVPGQIMDVLVVDSQYLATHNEHIRKLLHGWLAAQDYLRLSPQDAARRMVSRMGITGDEFLKSMTGLHIPDKQQNLEMLGGNPPAIMEIAAPLQDFMLKKKLLHREINIKALFTENLFSQPL